MASKFNPRWLRRGRVAYKDDGDFLLLIESKAPGTWQTLGPTGFNEHRSGWIAASYDRLFTNPTAIPSNPINNINIRKVAIILGASPSAVHMSLSARLTRLADAREKGVAAAAIAEVRTTAPAPSRAITKFEVQPYDPDAYWYESDEDTALYQDFVAIRQALHPINLLIAGPAGSGKTGGVQDLGKRMGIPVHVINCQAITTPEKWIGQMQADPEQGTYFVPSQHIQWVERTHEDCEGFDNCILLYDEITRLRPELNNMTYSLFDTQRGLEVPQMGRRVIMAQENMVIATANMGSAFTGTHTQDRAFRERFGLTMERSFPPPDKEIKILTSATKISEAKASELVKVADATRRMWQSDELESPISTRTLKDWSLLVAGNYSVKQAAEYTVIPLFSNDGGVASDRTKVAGLIEGKVL